MPTLAQAFDSSFQEVLWVVLAYLLAITTLIVSAGRLGDIFGRRRLFMAGIGLFTHASLLCGAAPTLWLLTAARAALGLGVAIRMRAGSAMGLLGTISAIASATTDITTASPEAIATGMQTTFAVAAVLIVMALAIAIGSLVQGARR